MAGDGAAAAAALSPAHVVAAAADVWSRVLPSRGFLGARGHRSGDCPPAAAPGLLSTVQHIFSAVDGAGAPDWLPHEHLQHTLRYYLTVTISLLLSFY